MSCSSSVDSSVIENRVRSRRRRKRRPNRHAYRKQSVLISPWYVNFLLPGTTRDLTRELSRSDRFGKFQSLFQMNLDKMEELTDILIRHGYIQQPRMLKFCEEFRERSEHFVLTALFRLGNGNSFRQCCSNTYMEEEEKWKSEDSHVMESGFSSSGEEEEEHDSDDVNLESEGEDYDGK